MVSEGGFARTSAARGICVRLGAHGTICASELQDTHQAGEIVLHPSAAVKRWRIQAPIPNGVRAALHAYDPVLAQVLYNRGQDTPERACMFLEGGDDALHSPFLMRGMADAVACPPESRAPERGRRSAE